MKSIGIFIDILSEVELFMIIKIYRFLTIFFWRCVITHQINEILTVEEFIPIDLYSV